MKALIIEDDKIEQNRIRVGLSDAGFVCDTAATGKDGYDRLAAGNYDIAIVDIRLEDGISGLDVVREAKAGGDKTPTIFLSAMNDSTIKTLGLNLGADDYLAKPYAMDELLARIAAVRRRATGAKDPDGKLIFEDIVMNTIDHTVTRGGHKLQLTKQELFLLEYLIRNRGRICSAETILNRVWDYNAPMNKNLVERKISDLRKKLTEHGGRDPIQNSRGLGYVLK